MKAINIKRVVVDASAVLALIFQDENVDEMRDLVMKSVKGELELWAPNLLKLEIANVIKSGVRSRRLDKDLALKMYQSFLDLKINYADVDENKSLEMAVKYNLTAYDAAYLYLSRKLAAELKSYDTQLLAANLIK